MIKNKKGFTLVEVLAVIVILGILSTIGVVTVINIRKNQEKKFDQNQLGIFKQTAKTYFSDNKTLLPTAKDSTNVVYLKDLIEQNYLDSLLDYNKNSYQLEKSYILVKRVGKKYIYEPYLYKNGDDAPTLVRPEDKNPTNISFTSYKNDLGNNMTYDSSTYYTNRSSKITYTIEDKDGIAAFNYAIYKNGKVISTSEYIEPTENAASDVFELNASNYEDGTYEIKVTVYDNTDIGSSSYSKKIMIDRVAPVCETKKDPTVEWANVDTTVKGICSDTKGKVKGNSGCIEDIKQQYTTEMNTTKSPGTVKDKAGNTTKCDSISVKIDKTKPIVVSLSASSQNTNYNTITANIVTKVTETNPAKYELSISTFPDNPYNKMTTIAINGNNNSSIAVSNSYDGSEKTIYVTVKDAAGNKATASTKYSVYKSCSKPTTNGAATYGNCSATCGSGTRTQTQPMKDLYLGVACTSVQTTVSCGTLPDCCSSVRYVDGSSCSVTCDTGTYNRLAYSNYNGQRCASQDLASGGSTCTMPACCTGPTTTYTAWSACSKKCKRNGVAGTQTRTKTVTQCDGTSTSTTESQACNTFTCCSSTTTSYSSWSTCKRRDNNRYPNKTRTATKYSTYDNGTCGSSTEEKTCTIDSHTHEWKARGNSKVTDNANWTCSGPTVHRGHNSHYNIYCKKCGALKTTSPKWVCPTLPYTSADGWVVVND